MNHRVAFAGFGHSHIFRIWSDVEKHPDCEIVAACELDPDTRQQLKSNAKVTITHEDFETMLAESNCSIVAIGDVFARRGALALAALKAGKHVIADKPLCISLEEHRQITRLAEEKGLSVGCQLNMVENGVFRRFKEIITTGTLGKICTVSISGQHPLKLGIRPAWYFEPGQHGGTINDIGVHVFHLVPWLTGMPWKSLLTARSWNAKAGSHPHFQDCAQIYAELENGATCFADVSYLAPDSLSSPVHQGWRIAVHGTGGAAETRTSSGSVTVITDEDKTPREFPAFEDIPGRYLQDFLNEIQGSPDPEGLTTSVVLTATKQALEAEAEAGGT